MKKIIVLIAIISYSFSGIAQEKGEINWITIEEALAAQEKEPRKIMMDMYTTWCGPCKMLDRNTFQNKDVAEYVNENYYAVKFNAEGGGTVNFKDNEYGNPGYDASKKGRNTQHQFAQFLRVQAYPTIVFLDENADMIAPVTGYHTPNQLEIFLKLFATDEHKNVTTKEQWETYQKEFKAEFGKKDTRSESAIAKIETKVQEQKAKINEPLVETKKIAQVQVQTKNPKQITAEVEPKLHVVVEGETLGTIASKYYKNAKSYSLIFEANKVILNSPNRIYPGQELKIPVLGKES